jgi:CelD/BcsL family acetyltransferase involved in cellulose biosynthesis
VTRFYPLTDLHALAAEWQALEEQANASFFLSWHWMGPWIRFAQQHLQLYVYEACDDRGIAALAVASVSSATAARVIPMRRLALNEISEHPLNFWIEYNGLLTRSGQTGVDISRFISDALASDLGIHEAVLSGLSANRSELLARLNDVAYVESIDSSPPWRIAVGPDDQNLEALLSRFSRNRRWQIRRSMKEYANQGELGVDWATSAEMAVAFLHRLGELHTRRWQGSGEPGVFANRHWVKFHESLIRNNFEKGITGLLRVSCDGRELGYLYVFFWRESAILYQNGFVVEDRNVLQPGFVSICLAVQDLAGRGVREFDLLSGYMPYKQSLAEAGEPLEWLRVRRRCFRVSVARSLDQAARRVKSILPVKSGRH